MTKCASCMVGTMETSYFDTTHEFKGRMIPITGLEQQSCTNCSAFNITAEQLVSNCAIIDKHIAVWDAAHGKNKNHTTSHG